MLRETPSVTFGTTERVRPVPAVTLSVLWTAGCVTGRPRRRWPDGLATTSVGSGGRPAAGDRPPRPVGSAGSHRPRGGGNPASSTQTSRIRLSLGDRLCSFARESARVTRRAPRVPACVDTWCRMRRTDTRSAAAAMSMATTASLRSSQRMASKSARSTRVVLRPCLTTTSSGESRSRRTRTDASPRSVVPPVTSGTGRGCCRPRPDRRRTPPRAAGNRPTRSPRRSDRAAPTARGSSARGSPGPPRPARRGPGWSVATVDHEPRRESSSTSPCSTVTVACSASSTCSTCKPGSSASTTEPSTGAPPGTAGTSREDGLRRVGLEVFRGTGPDLVVPERLVERMHAARRRARWPRPAERAWTVEPPPWWQRLPTLDELLDGRDVMRTPSRGGVSRRESRTAPRPPYAGCRM